MLESTTDLTVVSMLADCAANCVFSQVPPDPNLQMTFEADEFPIYAR